MIDYIIVSNNGGGCLLLIVDTYIYTHIITNLCRINKTL